MPTRRSYPTDLSNDEWEILRPLVPEAKPGGRPLGWALEIVKPPRRWVRVQAGEEPPPYPAGFIVLPRRWVIERTVAWILRNRRLSRDYEFLAESTEALLYVAMIRLMLRRLARGTS